MSDERILLPPSITEDRSRRERTLDRIQGQTIHSIVETTPSSAQEGLFGYQEFLSDKVEQAWLYIQTESSALSDAVATDAKTPWLDNMTSNGLTIRANILAQLALPVE